jgi:hypothetical protein
MVDEKKEIPGRMGIGQEKKLRTKIRMIHDGDVNKCSLNYYYFL